MRYAIRIISVLFLASAAVSAAAQSVTRGPYLQQQDDDSIIVRWRTDISTDSVVRYGTSSTALSSTAEVAGSRTEHRIEVTGLSPFTTYFYSIGDSTGALAGDASYYFRTSPAPGTAAPTRILGTGRFRNGRYKRQGGA
ncbi:MAG: fibronectin type III domain-containing protein [Pseudomonadota bacterium]